MSNNTKETSDAITAPAMSNLDHVFFFTKPANTLAAATDAAAPAPTNSQQATRSRDSSPGSTDTGSSGTMGDSGVSTTSSNLNPHATAFCPGPSKPFRKTKQKQPRPHEEPYFEMRQLPGKGYGLVATRVIPRGARIISEHPVLRIPGDHAFLACGAYEKLSVEQRAVFDKLHRSTHQRDSMENTSRMYLINSGSDMSEGEVDALVEEQVRVMSIFSANNFNIKGGLAVYPTAARLNHSCVPNAFHGFNPNLKRFTVHATRDIAAGEEITISYTGSKASFEVRTQRLEELRTEYGFTCTCAACSDKTGASDGRREILRAICNGLGEYDLGFAPVYPYTPGDPQHAFQLAVNAVQLLSQEGLFAAEYQRALNACSRHALTLSDWHTALQYALHEQETQDAILGKDVQDLIVEGTAASCWVAYVKQTITEALGKKAASKLFAEYDGHAPTEPSAKKLKKKKSPAQKKEAHARRMEEERAQKAEEKAAGSDGTDEKVKGEVTSSKKATPMEQSAPAKTESTSGAEEKAGPVPTPVKTEAKPPAAATSWAKIAAGGSPVKKVAPPTSGNEASKQRTG